MADALAHNPDAGALQVATRALCGCLLRSSGRGEGTPGLYVGDVSQGRGAAGQVAGRALADCLLPAAGGRGPGGRGGRWGLTLRALALQGPARALSGRRLRLACGRAKDGQGLD